MWTSFIFLLPLFSLFFFFLFPRRHHNKLINPPPGPKPWPVIGNLDVILKITHSTLHTLSQKYGPLMQLSFGSNIVVVASSFETAQLVLKTHDVTFASRPALQAAKYLSYNSSGIGTAPYGPYWRQARKICMMELLSPKRLDQFEYMRVEDRRSLIFKLFELSSNANSAEPVHLRDRLYMRNLATMSRMMFGKRYVEGDDEIGDNIVSPDEFKEMMEQFFVMLFASDIGDAIPSLAFLDLQGNVKRMKDLNKKLDRFYEHILDDHYARRKSINYEVHDMVDVLLELADDPTLEVKLERHHIKSLIQDILLGGIDTSAVTVEWAMSELLKKPEIFEKAREELDRVIGRNRWVEEKDINDLPYMQAIVKEVLRLHPAATVLVPREARENCKLAGYDIHKGSRVFVNVWAIGRDPTLWENPNEFRPERFIGKGSNIDVVGHNFELLPFGSGRRMCIGYNLGLKTVHSTLANLLHGFEWTLANGMKKEDLDMEERFGLTTSRVNPLLLVPKSRLHPDLYSL